MSHPDSSTSATIVFRDLVIGDVIPIAHCTPHGKHTSPYVIGGHDLVDGLIHLQLRCIATGRTMHLVGAPDSTTRRIGQLTPCSTATPSITHGEPDYLNPFLHRAGATSPRPYSCSHDLTGVQRLLYTRPGAVVLDPGGHALGLDLSTSLLANNPDAMLSAVRGVYRQLRMRLSESEKAGVGFWPRDPLGLVVFDLQACFNGLTSYGQRRSLNLMVDVLFCMGPAMNIKVLQPARTSEQSTMVRRDPLQVREVVAS